MLDMANHELIMGTEDLGEAVSYCLEDDCAEVIVLQTPFFLLFFANNCYLIPYYFLTSFHT